MNYQGVDQLIMTRSVGDTIVRITTDEDLIKSRLIDYVRFAPKEDQGYASRETIDVPVDVKTRDGVPPNMRANGSIQEMNACVSNLDIAAALFDDIYALIECLRSVLKGQDFVWSGRSYEMDFIGIERAAESYFSQLDPRMQKVVSAFLIAVCREADLFGTRMPEMALTFTQQEFVPRFTDIVKYTAVGYVSNMDIGFQTGGGGFGRRGPGGAYRVKWGVIADIIRERARRVSLELSNAQEVAYVMTKAIHVRAAIEEGLATWVSKGPWQQFRRIANFVPVGVKTGTISAVEASHLAQRLPNALEALNRYPGLQIVPLQSYAQMFHVHRVLSSKSYSIAIMTIMRKIEKAGSTSVFFKKTQTEIPDAHIITKIDAPTQAVDSVLHDTSRFVDQDTVTKLADAFSDGDGAYEIFTTVPEHELQYLALALCMGVRFSRNHGSEGITDNIPEIENIDTSNADLPPQQFQYIYQVDDRIPRYDVYAQNIVDGISTTSDWRSVLRTARYPSGTGAFTVSGGIVEGLTPREAVTILEPKWVKSVTGLKAAATFGISLDLPQYEYNPVEGLKYISSTGAMVRTSITGMSNLPPRSNLYCHIHPAYVLDIVQRSVMAAELYEALSKADSNPIRKATFKNIPVRGLSSNTGLLAFARMPSTVGTSKFWAYVPQPGATDEQSNYLNDRRISSFEAVMHYLVEPSGTLLTSGAVRTTLYEAVASRGFFSSEATTAEEAKAMMHSAKSIAVKLQNHFLDDKHASSMFKKVVSKRQIESALLWRFMAKSAAGQTRDYDDDVNADDRS